MFVRFACVSFSCLLFLFTIYANSEVLYGSVEEYSLCATALVLLLLHQQSAPYYDTRTTSVPGAVTVQGIQYYYMMYTLMYK